MSEKYEYKYNDNTEQESEKSVELKEKNPNNIARAYILRYWNDYDIHVEDYESGSNSNVASQITDIKQIQNEEISEIYSHYNVGDLKKAMQTMGFKIETLPRGSEDLQGFASCCEHNQRRGSGKVIRNIIPRIIYNKDMLFRGVVVE